MHRDLYAANYTILRKEIKAALNKWWDKLCSYRHATGRPSKERYNFSANWSIDLRLFLPRSYQWFCRHRQTYSKNYTEMHRPQDR